MIPWGAVRTLARHELRRRWRTLVVLGVGCGIFAGLALAVAGILWRTDSAHDRLVTAGRLADVQITTFNQFQQPAVKADLLRDLGAALAQLRANPAVAGYDQVAGFVGKLGTSGVAFSSILAPQHPWGPISTPVVIEGRMVRSDSPDEVVVEESRAAAGLVRVGDTIPVDLLTMEQYNAFSTGFGAPEGGHVDLHVVGVFRTASAQNGFNSFLASPEFYRHHQAQAIAGGLLIRTRGHAGAGAGPGSLGAEAARLEAGLNQKYGRAQTPYVDVAEPRRTTDPALGPTRAVLRSGLLALLGVVVAAGLILAGQLAGRWAERGRDSQSVEYALGLRARERTVARWLAATPAIVIAAVLSGVGALIGGLAAPLGSMERYEPSPGWLPRPLYAVAGPGLVAVVATMVVVVTTLRAGGSRRTPSSRRGRWRNSLSLPRVPLFASALTARGGGASTSLPVRSMVVGLATMLAVLVVVADIHAQLSSLAGNRASWGANADFSIADDTPEVDARLVRDPRVRDAERLLDAPVTIRHNGHQVDITAYGRRPLKGALPYTTSSGRIPTRAGEVALGPRAAHDLDAEVGDRVEFVGARGGPASAVVVGTVVNPGLESEALGSNAMLTYAGLERVASHAGYTSLSVRARDAAARAALLTALGRQLELAVPTLPRTIEALDSLGTATRVLLVILLLAAVLLVAQNARLMLRRRGGQLAIADAMGLSQREQAGAVVSALVVTSGLAAVIGVPFGWAVSRVVLAEIGPLLGLGLHSPDVLPALLAAAAVAALTLFVAALAASMAARRRAVSFTED